MSLYHHFRGMAYNYINEMRPLLNGRAAYSDLTADYVIPQEPNAYGRVRIRFRSAKDNVDKVHIICNGERIMMSRAETRNDFDYYEAVIQLDDEAISYYFEIRVGKVVCYYNLKGVQGKPDHHYDFTVIPGFKTPDWAKGAVMYQIYVDRFYNGDQSNDVETNEYFYLGDKSVRVEDWNKYPAEMGVREFYGGDLQGVIDKLDYLSGLGIDAIYFNPLFVSPSNHKYDIQDYDYIDPHIGKIVVDEGRLLAEGERDNRLASRYITRVTDRRNLEASNALFIRLVEEAHKRNIRVILDGVFNHCGSFNKWMDREKIYEGQEGYEKGAYLSQESPYQSFFRFYENNWPDNHTYDGWWGHDTLPKLNYEESQKLCSYILEIAKKWVSPPFNADGWRLDVAADLGHTPEFNHKFWKEFRKAVKEANPEAIILAEHYGGIREWLCGDEWDTVMNYDAFMEPFTWFLTGMEKHSDDYREDQYGNAASLCGALEYNYANFPGTSMFTAMNEISNHDHSRFLTRTNKKVGRMNNLGSHAADEGVNKAVLREAVMIQLTWVGAPTIYYGDEAGVCGFTDPDNRRTYPWGQEDQELIRYHQELIALRHRHPELQNGSTKILMKDYNIFCYGRFDRRGRSIILINNNDCEKRITFNVWVAEVPQEGILESRMLTTAGGFDTASYRYKAEAGRLSITLPKTSGMLLKSIS